MSVSLPTLDKQFIVTFSHIFIYICHGYRKGLEDKTYPALDSPAHGECNSINYIFIENGFHKLLYDHLIKCL